ncbi:DNA-directed RNA polymerase III subunit RPC8 isoform X2 [Syngnathoides biaculeatus]|nr:DNA-directed RNA polymerase III subunit RPC8 isoform X2 [Syngnathoides biaculeatus]
MFVLVEMVDTVRIPPWNFPRQLNEAVSEELNKKLANKVVYNVGLCICLYDITKLEDSYIFPGDGASHTKVHFRYVVFHPFLDEILVGKIKYCSQEGVHVTMGFFDDILIPPESLQQPTKFDEAEQVWLWEYETDEGAHDLYMDQGEEIRFRVADEIFVDTSPTGPTTDPPPAQPGQSTAPPPTQDTGEKKDAPYTLIVRSAIAGVHLYCTNWNYFKHDKLGKAAGFSHTQFFRCAVPRFTVIPTYRAHLVIGLTQYICRGNTIWYIYTPQLRKSRKYPH